MQEYELKGRDRGQYGEKLIERLAEELQQKKVPSASDRSLTLYKQFYQEYPIVGQIAFPRLKELSPVKKPQLKIPQTLSAKSLPVSEIPKLPPESLISSLSFSHFVELMKIGDPLKRSFYEFEGIRGNWSTRDLKRQIGSLYYERTALSKNKKKLREHMSKEISPQNIGDIIRDPLNYYKKHEMTAGDNPPIGILLCTEKNHALVEYALGDENNQQLFVSKYQLELPSKQEMQKFLEKELKEERKFKPKKVK